MSGLRELKSITRPSGRMRKLVGLRMLIPMLAGSAAVFLLTASATPSSAQTPSWNTSPTPSQKSQAPAPKRKPAVAPKAARAAKQTSTPGESPDWSIQCQNAPGAKGFNCRMSRTVVLKADRKLLLKVTVTLPAQTKKPSLLVQTPFGLFLPAGVKLQIDDAKPQAMIVQTCNQNGCFAGGQISDQMLLGMKKGKQLKAIYQNLQKKNITVPLPLSGFAKHYEQMEGR